MTTPKPEELLQLLGGKNAPTPEQFKQLILTLDNHRVLAKVFLLEGTPHVFDKSPMRYIVFKELVADRFDVGSQDVCIVGSAKLGFSPSTHKYGKLFSETSDVDVVIISEPLFDRGSQTLFAHLNRLGPKFQDARPFVGRPKEPTGENVPQVAPEDWRRIKEAIRNFVYQNFNPGLLPGECLLRRDIFEKIGSTDGLFLALEPKVFVSKIRCRVFRTWKAAEDYYTNSLREAKKFFHGETTVEPEPDEDEDVAPVAAKAPKEP